MPDANLEMTWRGHKTPAPDPTHGEARPEAPDLAADMGASSGGWEIDLSYLDAVDLASALSFPASDPPALSRKEY